MESVETLGNKKIFAANLSMLLKLSKIDNSKLCKDLNIPLSTFYDWLNAKKYPRIDKLELLANYFKVSKSFLIEDRQNSAPTEMLETELVKKMLRKKGFLTEDEDITEEEIDRLIEFAKANKKFIMNKNN